ncbi:MAG: alpha/beta hydrolase [Steroidobacteraceae bacterium]|nr:alpha/beta hydrolase [Steroidobacteraceae bacterium]
MKRRFCDTSMGQVHVVTAGEAPGTPLLLLHQTPRSVDEFAEVIPLLARSRRMIAVDMPGYGCSDPVPGQPAIEDYARADLEVLDALGVERAIVVGHHTGAVIAVELAAMAPTRIERVVMSGPVYMDAAGRAEIAQFFKQWHVAADGSHLLDKWTKMYAWLPRADLVQRFVVDLFRAGKLSEQGHFAVAGYHMEDRLPLVRCPALLLYSERDPFATPARAEPLRQAFRPNREVTLDAGVFVANEAPEAFARAVLDYVEGEP